MKNKFDEILSQLSESEKKELVEAVESKVNTRTAAKLDIIKENTEKSVREECEKAHAEEIKKLTESVTKKAEEVKTKILEKSESTIKSFIESKEKETEDYKNYIVEQVDAYLHAELKESLPKDYDEVLAKLAVYEPIVEGFHKIMEENYIKFDTKQFGLLKSARDEILSLRSQVSESVESKLELTKKLDKLERSTEISKVCEGLTDAQREKAVKLLEAYDTKDLKEKFEAIRDIVLEENYVDDADTLTESPVIVKEVSKKIASDKDVISEETEIDEMDIYVKGYKNLIGQS
jgi:hypothetical protein